MIPAVGQQVFPSDNNFHIQPWLGLKLRLPLAGSPTVDGRTFPLPAALLSGGLNAGFEF